MEQHNSGDSILELWDFGQGWIPFMEAYLREATEYKLRYTGQPRIVLIQGIPVSFYQEQNKSFATFITPFQCGLLNVSINSENFQTYVYSDNRKLTEEQFYWMLEEILEEANTCFQISGLQMNVNSSGRTRDISWTQWLYIENSFYQLKQIFSKIEMQPFRQLDKFPVMMKREKVHLSGDLTLKWLDLKGYGEDIPSTVQNVKTLETINLYENQVLKQQLQELYRILKKYERVEDQTLAQKSSRYRIIVQHWLNSPFLKQITENQGPFTITQKFRKHPVYRLWSQWFEHLYKHNREGIGFEYPISLKDTFQLYEMWCYMKIVKILRERGYVKDIRGLFCSTKNGLFLDLAENKESRIKLKGQMSLYYQRTYQYNTRTHHTFTQKMIPDIVLEGGNKIIIFDPKYRVRDNLGTALGEMHKYRDGIIHRDTGEKSVHEVYILTPTRAAESEGMRYFRKDFHERYRMGAIRLVPGIKEEDLKARILESVKVMMK